MPDHVVVAAAGALKKAGPRNWHLIQSYLSTRVHKFPKASMAGFELNSKTPSPSITPSNWMSVFWADCFGAQKPSSACVRCLWPQHDDAKLLQGATVMVRAWTISMQQSQTQSNNIKDIQRSETSKWMEVKSCAWQTSKDKELRLQQTSCPHGS